MKRESFEAKPSGEEGRQYHVRVRSGEVAPVVLLPGDPERIEKIKAFWSQSRELTRHRGYIVETGKIVVSIVHKINPNSSCKNNI